MLNPGLIGLRAKTYYNGGETITTDYNVNPQHTGKTIMVIYSCNTNAGNNSASEFGMIRCGFDGNNFSYHTISQAGAGTGATGCCRCVPRCRGIGS